MNDGSSDEEDEWIKSIENGKQEVSLLKPCLVKFQVTQSKKEGQKFSKAIIPDEEGEEEEEMQDCPFEFKDQFQKFGMKNDAKSGVTYDDLLYHPAEDELNQQWAQKSLTKQKGDDTFFQLSCSKCFTPLTYSGQKVKGQQKKGDYQAQASTVQNVIIDQSKIAVSKQFKEVYQEGQDEFEMLMFKGKCKECEEEIALYDFEKKVVYFREVVPSYIA